MCRTVEKLSEGALCSILLLDRDELHLRHGAAPSLPEAYVHAIDGVAIGSTVGLCGTATFTRRQVIVSNIADDPLWTDHRGLALCHGLRACWSMPVTSSDGSVLGTFAVYYREPKQPTQADLQLIERAAHIVCTAIERKQNEEALRASEAFNVSVLNSLSAQIAVLNSQGIIIAVNKPWGRFTEENGSPQLGENSVGLNYLDVCEQAPIYANGEEAAAAQVGILTVLAGTQNEFYLEYPCHSPDQQRWFRMHVTSLRDSQVGVVVAHENITERKRAEEALRRSERQLHTVLDALPVGVWFTDPSGKPVLANPAAKRIWSGIKRIRIGNTPILLDGGRRSDHRTNSIAGP